MKFALAAIALGCASQVHASVAIECNGKGWADYEDARLESRIYIIDDVKKTVSQYDRATGGSVVVCESCTPNFGPRAIRLIRKGTGFWEQLDIDREAGTIWYYLRGRGVQGRGFSGSCEQTTIPKPTPVKRKF